MITIDSQGYRKLLGSAVVALMLGATACGGGGSASSSGSAVPESTSISWFVGDAGGGGNALGTGAEARFGRIDHLALDPAGNAWVFNYWGYTLSLDKISPSGAVSVVASWNVGGADPVLQGSLPMVVDSKGSVYLADRDNSIIRKISPTGVVSTYAGTSKVQGKADGSLPQALFTYPSDIAIDSKDTLYVQDSSGVRKITAAGVVSTLATFFGNGFGPTVDGPAGTATFAYKNRIAVDGNGTVYLTDAAHTVRKITSGGVVSTLAGLSGTPGSADGIGAAARFNSPEGMGVDTAGNLIVADADNCTLRRVSPSGQVVTLAGAVGLCGTVDGPATTMARLMPSELAVTAAGDVVFIGGTWNGPTSVRLLSTGGVVSTLAGSQLQQGINDGAGTAARFMGVGRMTADLNGNLYMVDQNLHPTGRDASIRKITPAAVVSTLAVLPPARSTGNTDVYTILPRGGLASDSNGNLFVGDRPNSTVLMITPLGRVSVFAGSPGQTGSTDGDAGSARFTSPGDVVVDGNGNVYVDDGGVIRKITPLGVVSTLAGARGRGVTIDGRSTTAGFSSTTALAVESSGRYLYVADGVVIRRLELANGLVTTVAGTVGQSGSADGTGYDARFSRLWALAIDAAGQLLIADGTTIRKMSPAGAVTTLAGTADALMTFTPGALPGHLGQMTGLALSGNTLYASMFGGIAAIRNLP